MTSTINSEGQTVVPMALRRQFELDDGTELAWQVDGETIRVVKVARPAKPGFLEALRRLGTVPPAPWDTRPVAG